jgi:FAD/FMN-containing dehydrogenase
MTDIKILQKELGELVGEAGCQIDQQSCLPFLIDYRKLYRGQALAVLSPRNTDEVGCVVKWCVARGIAVVPQGGNTSLMDGAVPRPDDRDAIVLSLRLVQHP